MSTLTAANAARLAAALDKPYRFEDGVRPLRDELARRKADGRLNPETGDGMIDWSRTKFNRMDGKQQAAYEAALKARKYYYLGGLQVPKIVFDAYTA
jgi:hypothetical protein